MPVVQRVYYFDRANRRLMVYDGYQSDMPFIDNVVDVRFEYFADRSASSVARPPEGMSSCVFDAGTPPVPRLEDLGGDGLHRLTTDEMTDGPVCGAGPNAFDGDLLRIRHGSRHAAPAGGRGRGPWPVAPCSRSPADRRAAYSYVPDFEVTFDVAPRNMTPAVFPR